MRLRLFALLVAVVMTAAPSHAALCEIACATPSEAAASSHSCHDVEQPTIADGPQLSAGAHMCGHGDGLPELSRTTDTPLVAPAMLATVLPASSVASLFVTVAATVSPPDPRTRTAPLRI